MDDFGNALHWAVVVQGWRCLGLYGYAGEDAGLQGLAASVDFYGLED